MIYLLLKLKRRKELYCMLRVYRRQSTVWQLRWLSLCASHLCAMNEYTHSHARMHAHTYAHSFISSYTYSYILHTFAQPHLMDVPFWAQNSTTIMYCVFACLSFRLSHCFSAFFLCRFSLNQMEIISTSDRKKNNYFKLTRNDKKEHTQELLWHRLFARFYVYVRSLSSILLHLNLRWLEFLHLKEMLDVFVVVVK